MDKKTAPPAVQAELDEVTETTVEWNGVKWKVPASPDNWPATALQALEQGKPMTFLEEVLGAKQWGKFLRGDRATAGAAAELTNLIYGAYGEVEEGE